MTPACSPGFALTGFERGPARGFHITFENGWTVSIQIGGGTYSGNYDAPITPGPGGKTPPSDTAEVAAWPAGGGLIEMPGGDTVAGYQSPAEVLALLNDIAGRPSAPAEAG